MTLKLSHNLLSDLLFSDHFRSPPVFEGYWKKTKLRKSLIYRALGNTPGRTRTCDLRIRNPLPENDNDSESKDLENTETGAYKPAYKENPKMAENEADSIPSDLAQIVSVWPGLPEHIKAAIKALVKTNSK